MNKQTIQEGQEKQQETKTRPGRINGKNSTHRSENLYLPKKLNHEIHTIFAANKNRAANQEKSVGQITQDRRFAVIRGFYGELWRLGYKIESVRNLKEKHLISVFQMLEAKGQSPATLQNKLSIMRTFTTWIGKAGMVRESCHYVKKSISIQRTTVVQEDKSWDGKGIDALAKIAEVSQIDLHVALWLELCLCFGLRKREAIMSRPRVQDLALCLYVMEGTKGGRARMVPIENDVQKDVLARAKEAADGKTQLLGGRFTLAQKINRFNYVLKKTGITLAESGITVHGLRHQYMHQSFVKLTGIEPPIRGGDISELDKDEFDIASLQLMERAGHSRVSIGSEPVNFSI